MLTEKQIERANKIRAALDAAVAEMVDKPSAINSTMEMIRPWKMGAYVIGDVRMYEGSPYKCVQAHDSTGNEGWNPTVASLWMQYHGTTPETARPWIAPTGAHDMYLAGEYMVYTDGVTYKCLSDTTYSPTDYAQAWEAQTQEAVE